MVSHSEEIVITWMDNLKNTTGSILGLSMIGHCALVYHLGQRFFKPSTIS